MTARIMKAAARAAHTVVGFVPDGVRPRFKVTAPEWLWIGLLDDVREVLQAATLQASGKTAYMRFELRYDRRSECLDWCHRLSADPTPYPIRHLSEVDYAAKYLRHEFEASQDWLTLKEGRYPDRRSQIIDRVRKSILHMSNTRNLYPEFFPLARSDGQLDWAPVARRARITGGTE